MGAQVFKAPYSNRGDRVNVAAPAPVASTYPRVCELSCPDGTGLTQAGGYAAEVPGTSVAAPQVAGLAVLVMDRHPTKTAGEVKRCIVEAARNYGAEVSGHSFRVIHAGKAVECQGSRTPIKDIWTTSIFCHCPGGGGPGGGANNEWLIVGGWGDLYYALIEFNLTGLPSVAASARIELFMPQLIGNGPTAMYLDRITQFWDWRIQGTGRDRERLWWADRPAAVQWRAAALPPPRTGEWYSIDITDLYNAWKAGTHSNYGIQLRPVSNNNNWSQFYSSEYAADPSLRPKLVVVPN